MGTKSIKYSTSNDFLWWTSRSENCNNLITRLRTHREEEEHVLLRKKLFCCMRQRDSFFIDDVVVNRENSIANIFHFMIKFDREISNNFSFTLKTETCEIDFVTKKSLKSSSYISSPFHVIHCVAKKYIVGNKKYKKFAFVVLLCCRCDKRVEMNYFQGDELKCIWFDYFLLTISGTNESRDAHCQISNC